MVDTDSIKQIECRLQDDLSKTLFHCRLNALEAGDSRFTYEIPMECRTLNADIVEFYHKILCSNYERTVIFGAGFNGANFARELPIKNLFAFIDNRKNGRIERLTGKRIYALDEYIGNYGVEKTRFLISVCSRESANEMYCQLVQKGIEAKDIIVAPLEYRNNFSQYFDVFEPGEKESFVDCGCYNGGSAFGFASWCCNKGYDKIWCFEADPVSFERCVKNCRKLEDCMVFPYGVSDREGEVCFRAEGTEASSVVAEQIAGAICVKAVRLDEILKNERVTFIKMDIEGAEFRAVAGAKRIICEQKPRLAISVYHRIDDIITIPGLLISFRPDYKFCLRHYSLLSNETVLYAW